MTGYGRTNGQPAVTVSISKTSTANTVTVAQAVSRRGSAKSRPVYPPEAR
jgi:multidrug efflux pump subunit AcrB